MFRHGWLEKGVALIRENPRGFLADDAIVALGVGKNMVESIKYWCSQTGLIEEAPEPGSMQLTNFGEYIFGREKDAGVDPYLEDDATLWLLHYNLVARAPESALSIAINSLNKPEFSKAELLAFIQRYLAGKVSVSDKTLERDIDCFIHTYVGTKSKNLEESFDCPLLALSLVQQMGEGSSSINLYNATYAVGSPGQIFKLNDNAIVDAVEELERITRGKFAFTDTAGLNSIQFSGNNKRGVFAQKLLDDYYGVKA